MKRFQRFLKKIVILGAVPLFVTALVFLLFDFIQDSYTAEARLRVNESLILPTQEGGEDPVSAETRLRQKIESIKLAMLSEPSLNMLAFSLAVHDMNQEPPFSTRSEMIQTLKRPERRLMAVDFQTRLGELDLAWSATASDSSKRQFLARLGFGLNSLRSKLTVDRVPGSAHLRVQAKGESPEMSTFMVNVLCEEFIRYYIQVNKERQESAIEQLRQLLTQKKEKLEETYGVFNQERLALQEEQSDEDTWQLLRQIDQLEQAYQREKRRIESLKAKLQARQADRKTGIVPVRDWIISRVSDPDQLAVELGSALAHLEFIGQELKLLREQMEDKESALLSSFEEAVEQAEREYLEVLNKLRESEQHFLQIEQELTLIARGASRFPNPIASSLLAILAGVTSFLLWLIWLFQVKYLRWNNNSARNLP
jgi:hypothetical protein